TRPPARSPNGRLGSGDSHPISLTSVPACRRHSARSDDPAALPPGPVRSTRFDSSGDITPLTQKVIWAFWLRAPVLGRTRGDRDAVTDGDGVVPHQNVFNHEPHNALALSDTKRFGGTAQASEECCERLGQA